MKKQFRLYDLYRYAATGFQSQIRGIHSYECNADATTITVRFNPDGRESMTRFISHEEERKAIVTEVNKRLNNCQKPGRK